jgi:hypothetical protein
MSKRCLTVPTIKFRQFLETWKAQENMSSTVNMCIRIEEMLSSRPRMTFHGAARPMPLMPILSRVLSVRRAILQPAVAVLSAGHPDLGAQVPLSERPLN